MKQILLISNRVQLRTAQIETVEEEAANSEERCAGIETHSSGSECDSASSSDSLGNVWEATDYQNCGNCGGYCPVDFWSIEPHMLLLEHSSWPRQPYNQASGP